MSSLSNLKLTRATSSYNSPEKPVPWGFLIQNPGKSEGCGRYDQNEFTTCMVGIHNTTLKRRRMADPICADRFVPALFPVDSHICVDLLSCDLLNQLETTQVT